MIVSFFVCLMLTLTISTSQAIDISLVGADPGPNETGEIPAWEGHKNLPCPSDYTAGQYFPHPFPDEKPLFRIDHTNVDEHKDRLSPAQIMRLRKHKNFYMNIYPSRRNIEFCPEFYAAIEKNKGIMGAYKEELSKFYYDPSKYDTYLEQLGIDYPQLEDPNAE